MDTQPRNEEFLTLEATMQRLLDQMQQLREETESYSTARESLAATGDHIGVLTEQLGSVAGEVQTAARALREIGTPELLSRHDALQEQIDGLLSNIHSMNERSTTSLQAIEQNHNDTIQAISDVGASVERSKQELGNLASLVAAGGESLRQDLSTQAEAIVQRVASLETETDQLRAQVHDSEHTQRKGTRNLYIVLITLTVVAVGIVSAVIFIA